MVKLVGLLYNAGIPIETGTDSLAGFKLHRELELAVQAGIPPTEVLKLATLASARIMKKDAAWLHSAGKTCRFDGDQRKSRGKNQRRTKNRPRNERRRPLQPGRLPR